MIDIAATLIRDELKAYTKQVLGDTEEVVLGNIANFEDMNAAYMADAIVISNVIIEEESSLKNKRHFQKSGSGGIDYLEPPVYLNLYFLFCATHDKTSESGYEKALSRISTVVQFFQAKNVFNINNSPFSTIANTDTITDTVKAEIDLRAELYTMTFEQANHLWGSLGGKQTPHVMYKIRAIKIQERILQEAPLIEEIHENGKTIFTNP